MDISAINRRALRTLTETDCILDNDQVGAIAAAMSLLSRYRGGYELFGQHLQDATQKECSDVLRDHYQVYRTEGDRPLQLCPLENHRVAIASTRREDVGQFPPFRAAMV